MSVVISWYPSGRLPSTSRKRFTLAGAQTVRLSAKRTLRCWAPCGVTEVSMGAGRGEGERVPIHGLWVCQSYPLQSFGGVGWLVGQLSPQVRYSMSARGV